MNIKIFTISIFDDGSMEEEMNRFLRGNKILDVTQEIVQSNAGAYWCFCIRYLNKSNNKQRSKNRIDYREKLDEETFKKFSKLREVRKQIAVNHAVPAYMIFTDEELAAIAGLSTVTVDEMLKIKGVGEKKVQKYGKQIIEVLSK